MATTTNYAFNKPTVGGNENTWGGLLNDNWDALDVILGGITATEFSYLDGATSNIQAQIDLKAPISNPTFTGTATIPTAAITTVDFGDWTITESAGVLYFATGGTNKMKLDASGNLTVTGDITAYGTI